MVTKAVVHEWDGSQVVGTESLYSYQFNLSGIRLEL